MVKDAIWRANISISRFSLINKISLKEWLCFTSAIPNYCNISASLIKEKA
jgi:hypothetical protein